VHPNGATQCGGAERRLESFLIKEQICCSTFDFDSSNLAQGELGDIHQQKFHASNSPCQTWKLMN